MKYYSGSEVMIETDKRSFTVHYDHMATTLHAGGELLDRDQADKLLNQALELAVAYLELNESDLVVFDESMGLTLVGIRGATYNREDNTWNFVFA